MTLKAYRTAVVRGNSSRVVKVDIDQR